MKRKKTDKKEKVDEKTEKVTEKKIDATITASDTSVSPTQRSSHSPGDRNLAEEDEGEVLSDEWNSELINLKMIPELSEEVANQNPKENKITVFQARKTIKRVKGKLSSTMDTAKEATTSTLGKPLSDTNSVRTAVDELEGVPVDIGTIFTTSTALSPTAESDEFSVRTDVSDKAALIGKLVAGMVRLFMEKKNETDVQVSLKFFYEKTEGSSKPSSSQETTVSSSSFTSGSSKTASLTTSTSLRP